MAEKRDLFKLAYTDDLTGLFNRRYLKANIRGYIQKLRKKNLPLCFIMMDIDKFKDVNDTYGHYAGDNLLRGFGMLLKKLSAGKAVPVRYAGDEFVVIIPSHDKRAGKIFADKLLEILGKSRIRIGKEEKIKISISIGIASFPKDADNYTSLLQSADAALYKAKNNGRAQAYVFPDDRRMLASNIVSGIFPLPEPVGRKKEADYILNYVLSEIPQFPVITGELGAGKSYLLKWAEKVAYRENLQVLNITGYSFWKMQPLAALFSSIAHFREKQIGLFDEIVSSMNKNNAAVILDRLEIKKSEIELTAELMVSAPTEFILKLLKNGKTIMLIDDMQKLDEDTVRFINSFLHQFKKQPCYPIFAYQLSRADPTGMIPLMSQLPLLQNRIKPITLSNLKREDIVSFISKITQGAQLFSEEQVDLIYRNTDGRPLMVSETFKHLLISKKLYYDVDHWVLQDLDDSDLSMSLNHIASTKIQLLDEQTRNILTKAAMIGESFDIKTLSELTGIDEVELQEILRKAEDSHIITEADGQAGDFKFTNVIDINAFTDGLSQEEQNELHKKIVEIQEKIYEGDKSRVLGRLMFHLNQGSLWRQAAQLFRTSETSYIAGKVSDQQLSKLQQRTLTMTIAEEAPLDDADLKQAVQFVRSLKISIMNLKLYPKTNENVKRSIEKVFDDLQYFFTKTEGFTISASKESLIINGSEPPPAEIGSLQETIYELFNSLNLKGVTFVNKMSFEELLSFLEILCKKYEEQVNWDELLDEMNIENILPDRKVYVAVGEHRIVMSQDEKIIVGNTEMGSSEKINSEKSAALVEDYRGLFDDFKNQSEELLAKLKNSDLNSNDLIKVQSLLELINKKGTLTTHTITTNEQVVNQGVPEAAIAHPEKLKPDEKTVQMSAEDIQNCLFDLSSDHRDTRAMALAKLAKLEKKLPLVIFNFISIKNNPKTNRLSAYLIKNQGDVHVRAFLNYIKPGLPRVKMEAIMEILDVFADFEPLYRKLKDLIPIVDSNTLKLIQNLIANLPVDKAKSLMMFVFETARDEDRMFLLRKPEFLALYGLSRHLKPWLKIPPIWSKYIPKARMLEAARAVGSMPDTDEETIDLLKQLVLPSSLLKLKKPVPPAIRSTALWSLKNINPPDLKNIMEKLLKDKERSISMQAQKFLNKSS